MPITVLATAVLPAAAAVAPPAGAGVAGTSSAAAAVSDVSTSNAAAVIPNGTGGAELFYRMRDGSVATRTRTASGWSAATSIGGGIVGAPAAARAGQKVAVAVRGTDGALWVRVRTGTVWAGWQSLGGVITAAPAVTGWSDGRLDVFGRGTTNGLFSRTYRPGTGWGGWQTLGGVLATGPAAVASGSGSIDVTVAGTDHAVRIRLLRNGVWSGWANLGGGTYSAPAIAWDPYTHKLMVLVRGTTNGLYSRYRVGTAWTAWQRHGGTWVDAPAAAMVSPGQTTVVTRGTDLALWTHAYGAGIWTGWQRIWTPWGLPPPASSLRGVDWTAIPTSARVIALTFDAGGDAAGLPAILATLGVRNVPASFFLTGAWTREYPAEANQVVLSGYVVGNHSDTHPYFTQLTDLQVRSQVLTAATAILHGTGADARPLFRFPYGDVNSRVLADVNNLNYVPVRWSVDSLGWEGTSGGMSVQKVIDRVVGAARPGGIVLMHLGSNPNDHTTLDAQALPTIINRLRAAGYSFVTLRALTG